MKLLTFISDWPLNLICAIAASLVIARWILPPWYVLAWYWAGGAR